ncbi:Aldo/keto reductase [Clavulina sp. PMI_390]|nr:Aldo/keto reductase [Clavulina sp. PMI_390]
MSLVTAQHLGRGYGIAGSDEERIKVLDRLYELGERNIDTASIYGDSEELIGKWLKARPGVRDTLFLATKCGYLPDMSGVRGDPEFMKQTFKESLEKLGVEKVDLIYQHRPDSKVPIEITVGTLAEFVKEGKATYIGLSECTPATIRRAQKVHPITAVQIEYSPLELVHEAPGGVIETCRELGIAVVAFSPTARGLLAGRWARTSPKDFPAGDMRAGLPRFSEENFPKILKVVDGLKEIAAAHNATPAQVAIAWVAAQGVIVIPGAKQIHYVEENLAADQIKLSAEELARIRELAEASNWMQSGGRYAPVGDALTKVDTPSLEEYKRAQQT